MTMSKLAAALAAAAAAGLLNQEKQDLSRLPLAGSDPMDYCIRPMRGDNRFNGTPRSPRQHRQKRKKKKS